MSRLLAGTLLALLALACSSPSREHDHAGGSASAPAAPAAPAAGTTPAPAARVRANEATTRGIERMTSLVAAFDPAAATSDAAAYQALGASLQAEMDGIISACTMTGSDHEKLHEYLVPIFEKIAVLKAGDVEPARAAHAGLTAHLAEYGRHFE